MPSRWELIGTAALDVGPRPCALSQRHSLRPSTTLLVVLRPVGRSIRDDYLGGNPAYVAVRRRHTSTRGMTHVSDRATRGSRERLPPVFTTPSLIHSVDHAVRGVARPVWRNRARPVASRPRNSTARIATPGGSVRTKVAPPTGRSSCCSGVLATPASLDALRSMSSVM